MALVAAASNPEIQDEGNQHMPGFKTTDATCAMLGVTRSAVYQRWWRGQLQAIKVGNRRLFSEESIQRLLAAKAAIAASDTVTATA